MNEPDKDDVNLVLDWHDLGASVMELSHRSQNFVAIATQTEQDLRDLRALGATFPLDDVDGKNCVCHLVSAAASRINAATAPAGSERGNENGATSTARDRCRWRIASAT